jgi:hypothetical protein
MGRLFIVKHGFDAFFERIPVLFLNLSHLCILVKEYQNFVVQ